MIHKGIYTAYGQNAEHLRCTVLFKCPEGRRGYRQCSFRKYSRKYRQGMNTF